MATEAQLHHLYQQLHQTLDHEGATTMIELLGPYARHEPATKADLELLRLELRAEMAELRSEVRTDIADLGQRMSRLFVGAQGVTVAIIGLLLAIT